MPEKPKHVRTRMAPSPTGEYHIGHIRTLLYNWAFAKKHHGEFVIRIEDTDRERFIEGATERILDVIKDYGFAWDEGPNTDGPFKPYIQSDRLPIYKKYALELVDKGKAYYCFCTQERLHEMREEQKKAGIGSTKYDRRCLGLPAEEVKQNLEKNMPNVIRLQVPVNKEITFTDKVFGKITVNSNELDDQVLLKSDGFPTYHLAVVVDDHLMQISHVMRGNDWIPSTPKHVLLYEAFGWEQPVFIHLPNLKELGATKKLSKRFGPVSAREFLNEGYLPHALVNFLMFLGWNPGSEKEMYTLEEFVKDFSLEKIHKTDLVAFDRNKLTWMNSQYIQKFENSKLKSQIFEFFDGKYPEDKLGEIVPLIKTRIKTLKEFESLAGFFFERPKVDSSQFSESFKEHIADAFNAVKGVKEWSIDDLNNDLMDSVKDKGYKTGKFFMDVRIAITGSKVSPPINESLIILGRQETLARLEKFVS